MTGASPARAAVPYEPGAPVRFLVRHARGPVPTDGHVAHVAPTDRGQFRVDVTWPLWSSPDGLGRGRFYVPADGTCPDLRSRSAG